MHALLILPVAIVLAVIANVLLKRQRRLTTDTSSKAMLFIAQVFGLPFAVIFTAVVLVPAALFGSPHHTPAPVPSPAVTKSVQVHR